MSSPIAHAKQHMTVKEVLTTMFGTVLVMMLLALAFAVLTAPLDRTEIMNDVIATHQRECVDKVKTVKRDDAAASAITHDQIDYRCDMLERQLQRFTSNAPTAFEMSLHYSRKRVLEWIGNMVGAIVGSVCSLVFLVLIVR